MPRRITPLFVAIPALLAGCASYPDFSSLDDDSLRAQEAIEANIERTGEEATDEDRRARMQYALRLTSSRIGLDALRLTAEQVSMSAQDRREIEGLFEIAYDILATYALFPGRADETGTITSHPERGGLVDAIADVEIKLNRAELGG